MVHACCALTQLWQYHTLATDCMLSVLLQVLNVRQAARWFTQIGGCHEQAELFDVIAAQNGFPSRREVSANIDESKFGKDWTIFQQYTDDINPSVSWPAEYVPIDQQPANVMQLTLY